MFLICDALDYLVPFLQFIKHKETPIGSVTFSKVAGFSKQLTLWTSNESASNTIIPFVTSTFIKSEKE